MNWINAFLCFGQQRVAVNGEIRLGSRGVWCASGHRSWSVIVFLVSSHIIESEIRVFADDCVCYREIRKEDDTLKLQRDIDRL